MAMLSAALISTVTAAVGAPTSWSRGSYGTLAVTGLSSGGGGDVPSYAFTYGASATTFKSTPGSMRNATGLISAEAGTDSRLGAYDQLILGFGAAGNLSIKYVRISRDSQDKFDSASNQRRYLFTAIPSRRPPPSHTHSLFSE